MDTANFEIEVDDGYTAGDHANSYVSQDLEGALEYIEPGENRDAFILGFYATYEAHEIPSCHLETVHDAYYSDAGQLLRRWGTVEYQSFDGIGTE